MISHKKPKIVFVVQTSATSWHGSPDMSMRLVKRKTVLWWVLRKITTTWPQFPVFVVVPQRDKPSKLGTIVKSVHGKNVSLVFGSNDDVLSRIIHATKKLSNHDYIVRVLGLHYFFDTRIAQALINHVFRDGCDWAKPADDFEIQLTSEVVKVEALRKLDIFLRDKKTPDEIAIRVSPVHFITSVFRKTQGHTIEKLPLPSDKEKKAMRKISQDIYGVDRTSIVPTKLQRSGAQLTFHYELAQKYIPKGSTILDIASGDGFGAKMLAKKASLVVAADVDRVILNDGQKDSRQKNVLYIAADAQALPFADSSFDAVVSMETIEHVQADIFLGELKRVCKKNGVLILSTPQNRNGNYPINPFHNHEYSLEEIQKLVSRYFTLTKVIGIKTGKLIIKNDLVGSNTMLIAKNFK